jgi:hypothetical protein
MAGLVPAIHVLLGARGRKTWMPATSAGMTSQNPMPSVFRLGNAPGPRGALDNPAKNTFAAANTGFCHRNCGLQLLRPQL